MGCALNPTHVIYVGLFFDFSFSTSVLLHWWISWLWPLTSSLVINLKKKKCCLSTITAKHKIALWNNKKRKALKMFGQCRSFVQRFRSTTSHQFTASVVWPKDGCLRVVFFFRPGPSNSHLSRASATTLRGVTQLVACRSRRWRGVLPAHRCGLSTATNTERGRGGSVCGCCSATACEAQRLWDTSACSATAALITAETLTVCCLIYARPTLPLT